MKDKKKGQGVPKSSKAVLNSAREVTASTSSHGSGIMRPNGEGTATTVAFDKFAFTDEDEDAAEKKQSSHRSTERARRGKISKGIQHLWSLIPPEYKGSNSKETLVGILDKVAVYIQETQQKLDACFHGDTRSVRDAEVEMLQQKVAKLTEEKVRYTEALKTGGTPDLLAEWKVKGAVAFSSSDAMDTSTENLPVTSETKESKKRNKGNTVREHLKLGGAGAGGGSANSDLSSGSVFLSGSPGLAPSGLLSANGLLKPMGSDQVNHPIVTTIAPGISQVSGLVMPPGLTSSPTPGDGKIVLLDNNGKQVAVNQQRLGAAVTSNSTVMTSGPYVMPPVVQAPTQNSSPMLNIPMTPNQTQNTASLNVPGVGQVQGNLVLQNGQLILMNSDLTSAAMAAAGITGNILNTQPSESPALPEENPAGDGTTVPPVVSSPSPANIKTDPQSEQTEPTADSSAKNTAMDASNLPVSSLTMPIVTSNTNIINTQQVAQAMNPSLTPTLPPQSLLPQGVSTPGTLSSINNSITSVSSSGLPGVPAQSPLLLQGQNNALPIFPPQQPQMGMTYMTPQGQLVSLPPVQPNMPGQGNNTNILPTITASQALPSNLPSALLLPNGQVVPVVTQPSLLFSQNNSTVPQMSAATNTVITKPQPPPGLQPISMAPGVGGGLLMSSNTSTVTTKAPITKPSTLGNLTSVQTSNSIQLNTVYTQAWSTGSGVNPLVSSVSTPQAITSATTVTYSHTQPTSTAAPAPGPTGVNVLPASLPSQAFGTTSGTAPPNAVINKAGQVSLQGGQVAMTPSSVAVTTNGTLSTTVAGQPVKTGTSTTSTAASGMSSLPSTMTAVVSADGSIVLTLPQGPQPGSFMIDPNTIPSLLPGLSGTPTTPTIQTGVKKNKKGGQRALRPKPVDAATIQTSMTTLAPQKWLTTVNAPSNTAGTQDKVKEGNQNSSSSNNKVTSPLTIVTTESSKEASKTETSSSSASAHDILAQAAESIFATSIADISPPISSFYSANDDNALQIDTSATETQSDNEVSHKEVKKLQTYEKSKHSSGSSKKSKHKKKSDEAVSSGKSSKIKTEKKIKSPHRTHNSSSHIKAPAAVLEQSPLHGVGDDNDEMVIDLQNESLQSPTPQHCEENKQNTSEVEKSLVPNLNMPTDFGSSEMEPEKNVLPTDKGKALKTEDVSDLLPDVLESSMVASGITPTDTPAADHASPPPVQEQCASAALILPQFDISPKRKEGSKKKSKDRDSKSSKSSKSKSPHKKQKASSSNVLDASTESIYLDLNKTSDSDTVVSKKENLNPTMDVIGKTVATVNLTTSPPKKKSSKKSKAVDPTELLPDHITFSESDLADVLDQVESLGAKLNTSPKKSGSKRKKSSGGAHESPTKRKKSKGRDVMSPDNENSNSMSADLLERAMKDIGPLDMDLSEPESLSDQPIFSRFLGNTYEKSKDLGKAQVSPQLVVNTNTSDDDVENTENGTGAEGDKLTDLDTEKLDSPPRAPLSPVPQKPHVTSPTPPSSPDRSILDSISSIVATSSETFTHASTISLSTLASTSATTTDTYSHSPVSTPLLTPVTSPPSRLQGPVSPMFNTSPEVETKPAARHINLVSLAQSLAPPTPKHSISHKQIITTSSVAKSQIPLSSVMSTAMSSTLPSHRSSPTPPVPPLSHRPHATTSSNLFTPPSTPTGSDSHPQHNNTNNGKKSSKSSKPEAMLLNSTPTKGKPESMERQLSIDLGERPSSNLQNPQQPSSPTPPISGLSIPSPSSTLVHMNTNISSGSMNIVAQHPNRVPSVGKQQPPSSLSQDSKPITPSPSPASSYTSPAHSNYSAELLFSPSSVSNSSKSVSDNIVPQTQRPPSCQNPPSGQSLPQTPSIVSSKSSSTRSQQQQPPQPDPQQQQLQQPRPSVHESNSSMNSRPLTGHQQQQQHQQQIPRSNFYSAENMVSKSGSSTTPGQSISKTGSSCRQSPAHHQDQFSVPMLGPGPSNARPSDVSPRAPPANPNFLVPFSLASSSSAGSTFSFSLSSTRDSTPTTSGRSQFETPPSFYGIPGMTHPHQGQSLGGGPPGSGQLSPMFMPHGPPNPGHPHSMGNLTHPDPRQGHRQSTSQAITTQASNTSTTANVGSTHQRGNHYPNYQQENANRSQGMHGGREMGQYQPPPMMSASHESNKNTSQQQPRNNSNNANSMPPTPSLHSSSHNMGVGGSGLPLPHSRSGRNDLPFFAPGFPPLPGQAGNSSSTSANQTPHLHHPPRPGTGPSPGPHRPGFDAPNPPSQRYPPMPAQAFNGHPFDSAHMQFQARGVSPAGSGGATTQGSVGAPFQPQGSMDNQQMQKSGSGNQSRGSVQASAQHNQQPQSQRPSNKNMSSSSSNSKTSSKSSKSKQKKSSAANRCEVDTNLSNSIFETGRSMTPLFPMATMSPPTTRPLQSDGPTYLPTNLFSNAPRPLGGSNPLQHKNADINPSFGQLFQRGRPQNGLGLNFQPGFSMNSVHSSPHVSAGPAQMITPHSNAGSVVSHMTNFNLNLFPDVNNGPGGPTGGQGPDSLNMSPIKFASAHGNILGPPSGPPGGGLENPGLQPHPAGGAQIYHQHRGPHQMAAPNMLHNAMTINSLLSHNAHSFDPRQVSPAINGSMGPPFGSHPHHPSFSMPLNF